MKDFKIYKIFAKSIDGSTEKAHYLKICIYVGTGSKVIIQTYFMAINVFHGFMFENIGIYLNHMSCEHQNMP